MVVKVIRTYDFPDFYRQSPGETGNWKDIKFSLHPKKNYDLLICLNPPITPIQHPDPPTPGWLFTQEPPVEQYQWHTGAFPYFDRVFTQHRVPQSPSVINTQTCLPWHINMSYDQLCKLGPGEKSNTLSTVTSNLYQLEGHKKRWDFLHYLQNSKMALECYGKGFRFLNNKFDGLYPFRYSIAIENSFFPDYWTEKLADCFLSWTMPIYCGCTNITKCFPEESLIHIDLEDFERSKAIIEEAIQNDKWKKNLDAINEARKLILEKYQFFPFVYDLIENHYTSGIPSTNDYGLTIPAFKAPPPSLGERIMALGSKVKKFVTRL